MLVPSDVRNDGVQDRSPDALGRKDRRPPIVLGLNDGFRPKLLFATRFTNGLSWSTSAGGSGTFLPLSRDVLNGRYCKGADNWRLLRRFEARRLFLRPPRTVSIWLPDLQTIASAHSAVHVDESTAVSYKSESTSFSSNSAEIALIRKRDESDLLSRARFTRAPAPARNRSDPSPPRRPRSPAKRCPPPPAPRCDNPNGR